MATPSTKPKRGRTGIWRIAPLRLLLWIDRHESPALTKYAIGLLVIATVAAVGAIWQNINCVSRVSVWIHSALRREVRVELWMLVLCCFVPLLGVAWVCLDHLRRLRRLENSIRFVRENYIMEPLAAAAAARIKRSDQGRQTRDN